MGGKQARIAAKSTAVSTSTRNFPNRLGQGADVYPASAELAAVAAIMGKLPTKDEYLTYYESLASKKDSTYKYLNFRLTDNYVEAAKDITIDKDVLDAAKQQHAAFVA